MAAVPSEPVSQTASAAELPSVSYTVTSCIRHALPVISTTG